MTEGNKRRAYIGARTDEQLCAEGIALLKARSYPKADILFSSPMKRCIMTAEYIYPGLQPIVCAGLREMDFGAFEGKTYEELKDNPAYMGWLKSGGEDACPGGESKKTFSLRSKNAFRECVELARQRKGDGAAAAFTVHGGTIMAIMEEYGTPKGEYYRWQIKNGEMLELVWQ